LQSPETAELIKQALAGDLPVVPDRHIVYPWPTWKLRFTVMFGILILGFLAGLMEIVKERPILDRESAHGVRTSAYIVSKLVLLGLVLALQVIPAVCVLQALFKIPQVVEGTTIPTQAGLLGSTLSFILLSWLAGMVCAGTGMFVSGMVKSREQALLVLPLLILPQLLLGGMLIRLKGGFLTNLAELFVPSFWAFRGSIDYVIADPPVPLFDLGKSYTPWQAGTALLIQMLVVWTIAYLGLFFSLRRKPGRTR